MLSCHVKREDNFSPHFLLQVLNFQKLLVYSHLLWLAYQPSYFWYCSAVCCAVRGAIGEWEEVTNISSGAQVGITTYCMQWCVLTIERLVWVFRRCQALQWEAADCNIREFSCGKCSCAEMACYEKRLENGDKYSWHNHWTNCSLKSITAHQCFYDNYWGSFSLSKVQIVKINNIMNHSILIWSGFSLGCCVGETLFKRIRIWLFQHFLVTITYHLPH